MEKVRENVFLPAMWYRIMLWTQSRQEKLWSRLT